MLRKLSNMAVVLVVVASGTVAMADTFGIGANQFTIDFVPISDATNPTNGIPEGGGFTFTGVNNTYRMGTYEITNDQWNKFQANFSLPVTGSPSEAYDSSPYYTGAYLPTNSVSWHEAAQFVNWLNTSKGYQPAYKFTGTQGTGNYMLGTWAAAEAAGGANLYRNKDAFYFLPTENEWVKAAHWNGSSLQDYATKNGSEPIASVDSNYHYFSLSDQPWVVGSGSQELNGTYDMMGNVFEWTESPWTAGDYVAGSLRALRGGSFYDGAAGLDLSNRYAYCTPTIEGSDVGFRVASIVPEPGSITLLVCGAMAGLIWRWRKIK